MKKPITQRISDLKARQDQLANRLTALQAKAKTDERKRDTRRKIIIGAAVLAHMEIDPAFAATLRAVLHKAVTRDQDIKALGELLSPPAPAQTPPVTAAKATEATAA